MKIKSLPELYNAITENERIIVDVLRQIVIENLPSYCKEKISFNVPYFHGNKGLIIIWPASIPRGGIKKGVLLGFWYGNRLKDVHHYLSHGTNKQIFYKIFDSPEVIDETKIITLIHEALIIDKLWTQSKKHGNLKK